MDFSKLILETKDAKTFQKEYKDLIIKDQKVKSLIQAFRKDEDKVVDYIDYVMTKYDKELDKMMKEYHINYDEAIGLITKGI